MGVNPLTLGSNYPYCQPCNSCNVSLENLVLDQLIIPKLIFFFILITWLVDIVFDIVSRNSVLVNHGSISILCWLSNEYVSYGIYRKYMLCWPFNSHEWSRLNFSLQHQHRIKLTSGENKDENSIRGRQVDPIPNSPNWNHKYFKADSRENY